LVDILGVLLFVLFCFVLFCFVLALCFFVFLRKTGGMGLGEAEVLDGVEVRETAVRM
jgi:preprotein translocase subunit SecG